MGVRAGWTFICDLTAEQEITVWGTSAEKRERIALAMASQARIAKADREELAAYRGRKTASFPARALWPHGKGELPEAEGGGPAVVGSMVQGPGKGRARLVQDTGGGAAVPTSEQRPQASAAAHEALEQYLAREAGVDDVRETAGAVSAPTDAVDRWFEQMEGKDDE